jgi:hypothetical protein
LVVKRFIEGATMATMTQVVEMTHRVISHRRATKGAAIRRETTRRVVSTSMRDNDHDAVTA